jgi:hypothetical protein
MAWVFGNPEKTVVIFDDGKSSTGWDPKKGQPIDIDGEAGTFWRLARKPKPKAFKPPREATQSLSFAELQQRMEQEGVWETWLRKSLAGAGIAEDVIKRVLGAR